MDKEDAGKLFKKVEKRLSMFQERNKKKTPILDAIQAFFLSRKSGFSIRWQSREQRNCRRNKVKLNGHASRTHMIDMSKIHVSTTRGNPRPIGFCVYTVATRPVIGTKEFKRIRSQLGLRSLKIKPPNCGIRFQNATYSSIGSVRLPLYTTPGIPTIFVDMEIIPAYVPALLELDVLDEQDLTVDIVFNLLAKQHRIVNDDGVTMLIEDWSFPLSRERSKHVCSEIGN